MSKPAPHQAMRPHGFMGRIFSVVMERMNRPACAWAVARLAPDAPARVLDIGYGSGDLLELCAERFSPRELCGVDPSELMQAQTIRRLERRSGDGVKVDVRLGTDSDLDWPAGNFAAVTAVHAFQFWPQPEQTLVRIRELLVPGGQLILILRLHGDGRRPSWLPNPLSASGDEVAQALLAVEAAGFKVEETAKLDAVSFAIAARSPVSSTPT